MNKTRLEAFSDGLFAVVITIMVLEMDAPIGVDLKSLAPLIPVFLSYVLSFIYGGIFWINHHHLMAATCRINSIVLWANLNFLFWLSLIPFFTSWVDENHASPVPVAAYGVSLFMVFGAYRVLELVLFRANDSSTALNQALKSGRREKLSLCAIACAVPLAFVRPFVSMGVYILIAVMWFMPDRNLDRALRNGNVCRARGK